jgi:hypothetical protein
MSNTFAVYSDGPSSNVKQAIFGLTQSAITRGVGAGPLLVTGTCVNVEGGRLLFVEDGRLLVVEDGRLIVEDDDMVL